MVRISSLAVALPLLLAPTASADGPLPEGALARLGTRHFRHDFLVLRVAFSPDGKTLATAGGPSFGVCLWDADTGQALHRLRQPNRAHTLAFSPDGKSLLVGAGPTLLDVATGKTVRQLGNARLNSYSVAFSPDGKTVAATASSGAVHLFDVATGKQLRAFDAAAGEVWSAVFSPDGTVLATGAERAALLWDVRTGKVLLRLPAEKALGMAEFSPDGTRLAAFSEDGTVWLWDPVTGRTVHRLKGHTGNVYSVAFAPDGKELATTGHDGTVRIWDPESGKELRRWVASANVIVSLAYAPDGKRLATVGHRDLAVRLWAPATGKELRPAAGHTGVVAGLHFSADGTSLLTHGWDRRLVSWDLAGAVRSRRDDVPPRRPGTTWTGLSAFAPDRKLLAVTEFGYSGEELELDLCVGDAATGKVLHTLRGHGDQVAALDFSRDGKRLLSASRDGTVRVWDLTRGAEAVLPLRHPGPLGAAAFSHDGKRVATGGASGEIVLWDLASGQGSRISEQVKDIEKVVFSPDGRFLAAAGKGAVDIWNLQRGAAVCRIPVQGHRHLLAFSRSAAYLARTEALHRLVPGGGDNVYAEVALIEMASGQEVYRGSDEGFLWSLAFSPDGRVLATGGHDSTVLLWDLTGRRNVGKASPPARLTADDLERHWADLSGEAGRAYRAGWALADDPARSAPFLGGRLRPVAPADPETVARLIRELDSKSFAARAAATAELERLGELAEGPLREALKGEVSAELRQRLSRLLRALEGPVTHPELLRGLRAVEVLEGMATAEARRVLELLAGGATPSVLTQAARRAADRLAARAGGK